MKILEGDCRTVLELMPSNSVDAIVTDPPYELGFMGKAWDNTGIANSVEMWRECLRVLKPGGYLLSFGGSRTYHRMACAIEDAGFEIRDQIMWLYGSGFPKSLDASKAIDKAARGVPQGGADPTSENHRNYKGGCSEDNPTGRGFGAGPGQFMKDSRSKYDGANRTPALSTTNGFGYESKGGISESEPLTEAAKQWNGWGTALKPAHEPICVARKPIEGTVAANVLKWGTGAINVDGCRVGTEGGTCEPNGGGIHRYNKGLHEQGYRPSAYQPTRDGEASAEKTYTEEGGTNFAMKPGPRGGDPLGRWPANVIHDGSDEVLVYFPDSKGQQGDVRGDEPSGVTKDIYGKFNGRVPAPVRNDSGSAARFFYCAKTSKAERGEGNNHPTVKPLALMRYLCRLVTPPGGVVLDPFMGSGSTALAAMREGFKFIGIELNPDYIQIARNRVLGEILS